MKKRVKTWLDRVGLATPAERLYFNLKTADLQTLRRHRRYRIRGLPDGRPAPPADLVYEVIATRWSPVYYDSGRLLVEDMEAILARNGLSLARFEHILDFGCGCGRLIRHVPPYTNAVLYGTDYNARLVDWCADNLPIARFTRNDLAPPLPFEGEAFDFLYARSVLTHLPEDLIKAWMDELHRVLRPGGVAYVTMHGRPLAAGLDARQRAAFDNGELVVTFARRAGENLCSSYASTDYVDRVLLPGRFERVDWVEGRDRAHLRQDVYVLRKPGP